MTNGQPRPSSVTIVIGKTLRFQTSNYNDILAWAMKEKMTCCVQIDLKAGGVGAVRLTERLSEVPPHFISSKNCP